MRETGSFTFVTSGPIVSIVNGGAEQSRINVDHPETLEFEYMQQMNEVVDLAIPAPEPISALHIGGCGCALAWAWEVLRPGSRQLAIEVDADLVTAVRERIPLPRKPLLRLRAAEGAAALAASKAQYQVIVRDAFTDSEVPAHLQTVEWCNLVAQHLRPGGIYLANVAHGGQVSGRADVAAAAEAFDGVLLIGASKVLKSARWGNIVAVGWNGPPPFDATELDRQLRRLPLPVSVLAGSQVQRWLGGIKPALAATLPPA